MEREEAYSKAAKHLTEYLTERGLKKSRERYMVLEAACRADGMFTAADIHDYITATMNFHLSLSTVYSTLELLTTCGIMVEHFLSPRNVKFEYALGRTAFKYMICSDCGKITAIHDRTIDRVISAVKTPRLHVKYYKTYIYGTCASCAKKEKNKLRKTNLQDKNLQDKDEKRQS